MLVLYCLGIWDLGGFILFPGGSIGYFWSGEGGFMDGERDVYERLEGYCKLEPSCVCFEVLDNWFVGGWCVKYFGMRLEDDMIVRVRG